MLITWVCTLQVRELQVHKLPGGARLQQLQPVYDEQSEEEAEDTLGLQKLSDQYITVQQVLRCIRPFVLDVE